MFLHKQKDITFKAPKEFQWNVMYSKLHKNIKIYTKYQNKPK
jgi:hypothetical protein